MRATALLAMGLALSRGAAYAQNPDVDALLRQGVAERRASRDAEALATFTRAVTLCRCAEARAQVALAEQALGRWVDADRDLSAALAAADDPWILRNGDLLRTTQTAIRRHVGAVEVACDVVGALVAVDGREVGTVSEAGHAVRATAEVGRAAVTVSAAGYVTAVRSVEPSPEVLRRVDVTLVPVAMSAPIEVPRDSFAAVPGPSRIPAATAWLSISGLAALLAGAVAQGFQQGYVRSYNDPRCIADGGPRDATCHDAGVAADRALAAEVTGYSLGGVLVVAAGVVWLVARGRARDRSPTALACAAASSPGVSCALRW